MVVTFASAYYAASHFQINTQTRNFISSKVPWRQDMIKMDSAFPQGVDQIVVVIDGKTMELAEAAAQRLAEKLRSRPELYQSVERQNGGPFFDRNALLFMPLAETLTHGGGTFQGSADSCGACDRSEPARNYECLFRHQPRICQKDWGLGWFRPAHDCLSRYPG